MTAQTPTRGGKDGLEVAERVSGGQGSNGAAGEPPARSWQIVLPWTVPPVKPNGGHGNIYAHAAKVKSTRQTMGLLARKADIPWLGRCEVALTWYVSDKRKRDADNLVWTLKPLADALAGNKPHDHKIVDDDTPDLMTKHMPEIIYRAGGEKQMVVTVTEL